jgi:HJR/Mrr/RecB family endonuclease
VILNEANFPQPLMPKAPHVFLSYASQDKVVASEIAKSLQQAGVPTWVDSWELAVGDSLASRIHEALDASDTLVVLLSPNSVGSRWIQNEWHTALTREVEQRSIHVIPVLVEDCELPPFFSNRLYFDLRTNREQGIAKLTGQLIRVPQIEFARLGPEAFETLIANLLKELGFRVEMTPATRDGGYDILARRPSVDPFGKAIEETWLVEAKHLSQGRISLSSLRALAGVLTLEKPDAKGLIITSSKLTSVAKEYLDTISQRTGRTIRVVEREELTKLLLDHPDSAKELLGENG